MYLQTIIVLFFYIFSSIEQLILIVTKLTTYKMFKYFQRSHYRRHFFFQIFFLIGSENMLTS